MFANAPDFRDSLTVEQMPPSYRVVPKQAEQTEADRRAVRGHAPAWSEVSYAKEEVDALVSVTNFLQIMLWAVALVLLLAASLLILNTIRMAIFARRREVAVMKLVGATNWFIRVPFMFEGLFQGLVGAAAGLRRGVDRPRPHPEPHHRRPQRHPAVQAVPRDQQRRRGHRHLPAVVGVIVGTVGSAFAVSRFLDV